MRQQAFDPGPDEEAVELSLYSLPLPQGAQLDIDAGIHALDELHSLILEDESRLGIVLIPSKRQLSLFANTTLNPQQPNALMTLWAGEKGIPVLDLHPFLRETSWETLYWQEDAHFNPSGQEQVAVWLESWLFEEHLFP